MLFSQPFEQMVIVSPDFNICNPTTQKENKEDLCVKLVLQLMSLINWAKSRFLLIRIVIASAVSSGNLPQKTIATVSSEKVKHKCSVVIPCFGNFRWYSSLSLLNFSPALRSLHHWRMITPLMLGQFHYYLTWVFKYCMLENSYVLLVFGLSWRSKSPFLNLMNHSCATNCFILTGFIIQYNFFRAALF